MISRSIEKRELESLIVYVDRKWTNVYVVNIK